MERALNFDVFMHEVMENMWATAGQEANTAAPKAPYTA